MLVSRCLVIATVSLTLTLQLEKKKTDVTCDWWLGGLRRECDVTSSTNCCSCFIVTWILLTLFSVCVKLTFCFAVFCLLGTSNWSPCSLIPSQRFNVQFLLKPLESYVDSPVWSFWKMQFAAVQHLYTSYYRITCYILLNDCTLI